MSRFGAIIVVTLAFAGMSVALSIDTLFGIISSSMFKIWYFMPMNTIGPAVRNGSLVYLTEIFLSSATKVYRGHST